MTVSGGEQRTRRLGLVVNPVAGLGGSIAGKGSDDPAVQREAERRGVPRRAGARATRAIARVAASGAVVELLAAPGAMGADAARAAGLDPRPVGPEPGPATTAEDTRRSVLALERAGVDLLLVAGGDGTLRVVHDAVGERLPVLGIPAGVKMHSGAFASGPEAAGEVAIAFLTGARDVVRAEVADIDERAVREDRIAARLHGAVLVPRAPGRVLAAKGGSRAAPGAALAGAVERLLDDVAPGQLVLVGPGTTAGLLPARLGLPATLLGVDAIRDGRLVGRDLDERGILALLDGAPDALLVLGVVGVQGTLLGRGNQQLSPAVLRRIGRDRLRVLAAKDKLVALVPAVLRIDSGDPRLDAELTGPLRVRVSGRETMILPLER